MRVRDLIPDILTLAGLQAAMFSMYACQLGDYETSARAFFLALLFDYLDGVAARMLASESKSGELLDRFVDRVTQCVAPALLLSSSSGLPGLVVGAALVTAGAVRLAIPKGVRYFRGAPLFAPAIVIEASALAGYPQPILLVAVLTALTVLPLPYPRSPESAGAVSPLWHLRALPPLIGLIAPEGAEGYAALILISTVIAYILLGPIEPLRSRGGVSDHRKSM